MGLSGLKSKAEFLSGSSGESLSLFFVTCILGSWSPSICKGRQVYVLGIRVWIFGGMVGGFILLATTCHFLQVGRTEPLPPNSHPWARLLLATG